MTSQAASDSRLRRTLRSLPVVGRALRSAAISYHQGRADLGSAYRDLTDRRLPHAGDSAAVAGGRWLTKEGRRLLLLPYRNEHVDPPEPLIVGEHRFDVLDDLAAFTSLPTEDVRTLVARRVEDFRTEWLQWPDAVRSDQWFYLASRMYLFANAVHFHERPELINEVAELLPPEAKVLDFGGGTGNLSLALAAHGFRVSYRELSALQKDFTRFRVQRYGLQQRVDILDSWADLPADTFDAVLAFDVFEHLPDLAQVVDQVAASLVEGGLLVDTSSFFVGLANPMHHEDPGLESLLRTHGVVPELTLPHFRVWKKQNL